jgi:hypothetical protein
LVPHFAFKVGRLMLQMHYSRHNGLVKRFLDSNSRKAVRIIFTMALDLETYLPELPIVGETSRFVSAPFALSSTQ